jgi:SAM-dependent methyltransferase
MLFGTRETFEYRRCPACGVLWQPRPPADLSPYYPPAYHSVQQQPGTARALSPVHNLLHAQLAANRLFGGHVVGATIGRLVGPAISLDVTAVQWLVRQAGLRSFDDPILDAGSGPVPERLVRLRRAGFRRLLGIDPWIARDSSYEGIPVRKLQLNDVEGRYGLIMFHHSFEHVRDPRGALRAAVERLRPGGTILIRTPIMGSWFWQEYGVDWWELDAPRHVFVHSIESLRRLGGELGLELRRVAFDSTYVEIIASDQIRRGVAWRSADSYLVDPTTVPPDAVEAAKASVRALNQEGRAGRGLIFLRMAT